MTEESWRDVYENLHQAARFTRMADQIIDARLERKEPLTNAEQKDVSDNLDAAARHRQAAIDALTAIDS